MNATDYVNAGFALCVFARGTKGPERTAAWQLRENAITTPEQAARINGENIGMCHAWCTPTPTMALDIDDYRAADIWFEECGISLTALMMASDAVQIVSGRENHAKLIYRLPEGVGPLLSKQPATGRAQP